MLKVYQRYAPNALAPTTAYPLGSIKNDSTPGADDGTPLEKDWGNNIEGFHQALMTSAGLTANGTPDTAVASQLLDALKIVAAEVVKVQMRDVVYRVGSYYINDSNPANPATLLGFGTWERVEGRTLMGCDGTGTGTFGIPGAQGGSLTHTHTAQGTALTIDQIPSHTHQQRRNDGTGASGGSSVPDAAYGFEEYGATSSTGGGQPHTHTIQTTSSLQPYRVAYLWRRTA